MARMVKITTTSLATLEDVAPPYNLRYPDPQDTLALGLSLLDAAELVKLFENTFCMVNIGLANELAQWDAQ